MSQGILIVIAVSSILSLLGMLGACFICWRKRNQRRAKFGPLAEQYRNGGVPANGNPFNDPAVGPYHAGPAPPYSNIDPKRGSGMVNVPLGDSRR